MQLWLRGIVGAYLKPMAVCLSPQMRDLFQGSSHVHNIQTLSHVCGAMNDGDDGGFIIYIPWIWFALGN